MIILLLLSPTLYLLFPYLIELAISSRRALNDGTWENIFVLPLTSLRVFWHSVMASVIIQPVFLPLLSIGMVLAMGVIWFIVLLYKPGVFELLNELTSNSNLLQPALRESGDGPAAPSSCKGTTLISSLHIPPRPLFSSGRNEIPKEWGQNPRCTNHQLHDPMQFISWRPVFFMCKRGTHVAVLL